MTLHLANVTFDCTDPLKVSAFWSAALDLPIDEGADASFVSIGLGNPTTVSWGTLLYYAQQQNAMLTGQWILVLTPGLAIAMLAVSFTLINFGVDALSNPRLREK